MSKIAIGKQNTPSRCIRLKAGADCVDNVNASLLVSNLSFLAMAGVIIDNQRNTRFQLGTRDALSPRRTPCGLPSALAQVRNSELVVLMTRITSHGGTAGSRSHPATQWKDWTGVYLELLVGFSFDLDLDLAFRLVDWSGSNIDLTPGAPDLYPIRTAAEEE